MTTHLQLIQQPEGFYWSVWTGENGSPQSLPLNAGFAVTKPAAILEASQYACIALAKEPHVIL